MSAKSKEPKEPKSPNATPVPTPETDMKVIESALLDKFWKLAKQENELPVKKSNPKLTAEIDRIQGALLKIRSGK